MCVLNAIVVDYLQATELASRANFERGSEEERELRALKASVNGVVQRLNAGVPQAWLAKENPRKAMPDLKTRKAIREYSAWQGAYWEGYIAMYSALQEDGEFCSGKSD